MPACSSDDHAETVPPLADSRMRRKRLEPVGRPQATDQIVSPSAIIASTSANGRAAVIASAQRADPQQRRNSASARAALERVQLLERHASGRPNRRSRADAAVGKDVQPHVRARRRSTAASRRTRGARSGCSGVRGSSLPASRVRRGVAPAVHARRGCTPPGALPLKCRVSTSTRSIVPARAEPHDRPVVPGRRAAAAFPSRRAMSRAAPGHDAGCARWPKNMSLQSTTTPPCSSAARSISPSPREARPSPGTTSP